MRALHVAGMAAAVALALPGVASAGGPAPIDPQTCPSQNTLPWGDYKPLPGTDYPTPDVQPTVKKWKVALVVTAFPDKPFYLTQPAGSSVFGTPTAQAHDIPRDQVPTFLRDFLN